VGWWGRSEPSLLGPTNGTSICARSSAQRKQNMQGARMEKRTCLNHRTDGSLLQYRISLQYPTFQIIIIVSSYFQNPEYQDMQINDFAT
jgi:hypothetical protein